MARASAARQTSRLKPRSHRVVRCRMLSPFVCVSLSVGRCLGTTTAVTSGPPALIWTARISARRGTMAVGARRPASVALSMRATSDSPRDGRAAARITAVLTTTHAAMASRRSACDWMASHSLLLNIKIHGSRIQRKTGPVQVQGPLWKTVLLHFRKKRCHRRILPVAVLPLLLSILPYFCHPP